MQLRTETVCATLIPLCHHIKLQRRKLRRPVLYASRALRPRKISERLRVNIFSIFTVWTNGAFRSWPVHSAGVISPQRKSKRSAESIKYSTRKVTNRNGRRISKSSLRRSTLQMTRMFLHSGLNSCRKK